ncbi:hypothetical protein BHE74_00045339, partial [Ensete ventricosum]
TASRQCHGLQPVALAVLPVTPRRGRGEPSLGLRLWRATVSTPWSVSAASDGVRALARVRAVVAKGFFKRVNDLGLWKLDCVLSLLDLGGSGGVFLCSPRSVDRKGGML